MSNAANWYGKQEDHESLTPAQRKRARKKESAATGHGKQIRQLRQASKMARQLSAKAKVAALFAPGPSHHKDKTEANKRAEKALADHMNRVDAIQAKATTKKGRRGA